MFVFGAGEIEGHLVIAMEVMQGTLADRLKAHGPLTPAVAVDAMLQLVAGLQVAAAAGILHRDVKPSNCFVDAQGVVKIGDFGISRSLRATEETALSTRGQHPATPAYASPEQLRGAALDVRADIYSVGATLYELLTGRQPFAGTDLMALLMAVANDAPIPPHVIAPAVPKGLSAVVLHCLAKQPEQRFADYDALAAALEPYSSGAPTTGTLGRRCLAGVIDSIPILMGSFPISVLWGADWLSIPPLLTMCLIEVLYFALCESRWAASPGKAICGLMIVQQGGTPASVWQVIVRAIVYVTLPAAPVIALLAVGAAAAGESQQLVVAIGRVRLPPESVARVMASPESLQVFVSAVNGLMLLVLFSTARRRNGYAAVQDLISRTRVVERSVRPVRWTSPAAAAVAPNDIVARLGPFAVLSGTVSGMPDGWRPGFDERLRRRVWIREVAPGTPSISPARRAINRATRLRWLAGRRNGDEAWDAFEAVQGVPLELAAFRPRTWQDVRWWVRDLARECSAQSGEDQPPRRRDRVWILDSGGAKLIDDPAVDQIEPVSRVNTPVAPFLLDVVSAARGSVETHALTARAIAVPPWPLRVHQFLDRLTAAPDMSGPSIGEILEALMRERSTVTRGWRALAIVIPLLIPVLWASTTLVLMQVAAVMLDAEEQIPADVQIAARLLRTLDWHQRGVISLPEQDREAIEIALSTRYRAALTNDRLFEPEINLRGMTARHRRLADDLLRRRAGTSVGPDSPPNATVEGLAKQATAPAGRVPWYAPFALGLIALVFTLFCVAMVALIDALAWRGGVMRLLGLELVTMDGRLASRRRVLARTALTWAPVLLLALITIWGIAVAEIKVSANISLSAGTERAADPRLDFSSPLDAGRTLGSSMRSGGVTGLLLWLTPPCLLLMLAGAIVAIISPARGIHDRLAGTWIVAR